MGGTGTAATYQVVKLTSGGTGVRALKLVSAGSYTVLPGAASATTSSGSGTGCTVTLNATATGITVTSGGSNYPEFPPPPVKFSGGTVYRKLVAKVVMTATATDLDLTNSGSAVKLTTLKDTNANQVLGARITGWGTPTGTTNRATFDQSTVTLAQLAQRVAALIIDFRTHGMIGT